MIRAFGTVLMKTANDYTSIIISSASFNLKPTVIWGGSGAGAVIDPDTWSPPMGLGVSTLRVNLPGHAMYISFVNPMPTRYYTVLCTYNGYEPYGYETIQTWTSPVGQTLTGFTMSFSGGDNSSTEGKFITNFMVLHP
jgi:peptidoglycan hydrolase-like protein with peptidoglycan-binding domain